MLLDVNNSYSCCFSFPVEADCELLPYGSTYQSRPLFTHDLGKVDNGQISVINLHLPQEHKATCQKQR